MKVIVYLLIFGMLGFHLMNKERESKLEIKDTPKQVVNETKATENSSNESVESKQGEELIVKETEIILEETFEDRIVEFSLEVIDDEEIEIGHIKTLQKGENGIERIYYEDVYQDGVHIDRKIKRIETLKKPIDEIKKHGTKPLNIQNNEYYNLSKSIFEVQNEYRSNAGVSKLLWNEELYNNAHIRAQEIILKWSHERPNGKNPLSVITIPFRIAGENLAKVSNTGEHLEQVILELWSLSSSHLENLLSIQYTQGAIATYQQDGIVFVVALFID